MSILEIHLFGKFTIYDQGQVVNPFRSQKALELLCFLLLHWEQPHHRDHLANIFWGERCTSESKKYLRKTLWQLHSVLDALPHPDLTNLIRTETDWLQINQNLNVWLDTLEFESIYDSLSGLRGRDFDPQQFQAAERAAGLYQGDLLEGCYQDWCLFERERLKDMYFILADKLMGYCEANQQYEVGIAYGRKLLVFDHVHENTHRRLMRLYSLLGNRTSAIRQYQTCKEVLKQEFNIEPAGRTLKLYQQVANDERLDTTGGKLTDLDTDSQSLVNAYAKLEKIRELSAVQAEITQKIVREAQVLEEMLNRYKSSS